jgi:hypothetical protein
MSLLTRSLELCEEAKKLAEEYGGAKTNKYLSKIYLAIGHLN